MRRWLFLNGDVKAMLLLAFFVVGAVLMVYFSGGETAEKDITPLDSIARVNAQKTQNKRDTFPKRRNDNEYYYVEAKKPERFIFDPNTADSTQLLRLGLQPWMVRNIYKYRAAGGIFSKAEDFAKVYGVTVKQYNELKPFIRISSDYLPASTLIKDTLPKRDTLRFPVKIKEGEVIVLNTADTTSLKKVPGIGSVISRRIVEYGKKLGGFVDVDQLDEVEDFPAEAKSYFVIENPQTRKININTASITTIKKHPYMGFNRAKTVVDYRNKYGHIDSLTDLSLHRDFTPDVIERLAPYIEY